MKIPISNELGDAYFDLVGLQARMDYESIRPSEITRYILNIFNHNGTDLTVEVIYNIIQNLHDSFKAYDYDKISEVSGVNIRNEVCEIKELFKMRKEEILF